MTGPISADGSYGLSLSVVTPSYRADKELCVDLVTSVLRNTGDTVVHHVIVPPKDLETFRSLASHRTVVESADDHLPRNFLKVPRANIWINSRRPFPPVRGWITQQILKLAVAASMTTDVVLLIDSDLALIRPITGETFGADGTVALFRVPQGIDGTLPRHRLWHDAARRLLGLSATPPGPLADYICGPCAWSPTIVRSMLRRIEVATGRQWQTAVARELHFSEMILYGVYVDEIFDRDRLRPSTGDMRCVNHYEETPLTREELRSLLSGTKSSDTAVMISAKSGTALEVRRAALREFESPAAG